MAFTGAFGAFKQQMNIFKLILTTRHLQLLANNWLLWLPSNDLILPHWVILTRVSVTNVFCHDLCK